MRKNCIIFIFAFALLLTTVSNITTAQSEWYLPDSTGLELQWEYSETPPKRPYPQLLNSDNYEVKWKRDSPLVFGLKQDRNGILYTSELNNIVRAVYPDGKQKWSVQLETGAKSSVMEIVVGKDGTLYAYGSDLMAPSGLTTIYAISPEGKIRWNISEKVNSRFDESFAGDHSGTLVYYSEKGLVSRGPNGQLNWLNEDIVAPNPSDLDSSHFATVFADPMGNVYVNSDRR